MAERVPNPAAFNGTHQNLDVFVAHLGIPLFSYSPIRQAHPTYGLSVHRLEGGAHAQVLRFVKNSRLLLTDFEDIIRILGTPSVIQTPPIHSCLTTRRVAQAPILSPILIDPRPLM
jgi:hypothetical protein